jgi:hypothetical protein
MLQAGNWRVRLPMESLIFLGAPNPCSCTTVSASTRPVIEVPDDFLR